MSWQKNSKNDLSQNMAVLLVVTSNNGFLADPIICGTLESTNNLKKQEHIETSVQTLWGEEPDGLLNCS